MKKENLTNYYTGSPPWRVAFEQPKPNERQERIHRIILNWIQPLLVNYENFSLQGLEFEKMYNDFVLRH